MQQALKVWQFLTNNKEALDVLSKILTLLGIPSILAVIGWAVRAGGAGVCGNVDAALEHLRRAAQAKDFDRAWAWQDPDLGWIRSNPRFSEIIGEIE